MAQFINAVPLPVALHAWDLLFIDISRGARGSRVSLAMAVAVIECAAPDILVHEDCGSIVHEIQHSALHADEAVVASAVRVMVDMEEEGMTEQLRGFAELHRTDVMAEFETIQGRRDVRVGGDGGTAGVVSRCAW